MDAVLDLTARAVAVIVLIQDTLLQLPKTGAESSVGFSIRDGAFLEFIERKEEIMKSECFKVGGIQINYISLDDPLETEEQSNAQRLNFAGVQINDTDKYEPPITRARKAFSYTSCLDLINWINDPLNKPVFVSALCGCTHYPPPEKWREAIRSALYADSSQRLELVNALRYMPLQVVLAAGGFKFNAKQQRLLQIWLPPAAPTTDLSLLLSEEDIYIYHDTMAEFNQFKKRETDRFIKLKTAALEYLHYTEKDLGILKEADITKAEIDKRLSKLRLEENKKLARIKDIEPKYPISGVEDPAVFLDQNILLKEEHTLLLALDYRDIPLSFLYIFDKELDEICRARNRRQQELAACLGNIREATGETGDALLETDFEKIFAEALNLPDPPVNGNQLKSLEKLIGETFHHNYNKDAIQSAREMKLWGLAFSGGGIRSATFNLGVLQGLAQKGVVDKFDYLSTVSGGGYLGSWFVSWVARNKSLLKVSDRLNPKKSSDPFAEEVAPIRWLRMYSNYLTPSTGIMSTDSWTVGMTLLRNMLINQILITFFLMALIAGVRTLCLLWARPPEWMLNVFGFLPFWLMSMLFLLAGTLLAGFGMLSYHKRKEGKTDPSFSSYKIFIYNTRFKNWFKLALNPNHKLLIRVKQFVIRLEQIAPHTTKYYLPKLKLGVTLALIVLGCITALVFSSWLYRYVTPALASKSNLADFSTIINDLSPVFYSGLAGLIGVYIMGRYYSCIPPKKRFWRISGDLLGTVIAAVFGLLSIILVCHIAYALRQWTALPGNDLNRNLYLAFILLPPLIIEVMTITVVTRMALLGSNFPDERREWWGRIGGRVHRISIMWIVVMSLIFLGSSVFQSLIDRSTTIKNFFVVGWGASLITGLRVAFISDNPGDKKPKGFLSSFLNWFPLLAPYLFGIAIFAYLPELVILLEKKTPALLTWIQNDLLNISPEVKINEFIGPILTNLILTALLAGLAVVLGRKIGVNQFSMHLFYKNRLVRGFLGATRQRHERQKSANPFTGFDEKDDLLLKDLVLEKGYFGPYPLINTTVNVSSVSALDRQDRKAESFTFSPHYCGFDFSLTRPAANILVKSYDFAYRPTAHYAYYNGPTLGTAMTISGAAANPNQGYHSNTATAFLLTLFNIRLGWWIGNPRQNKWENADPKNGLGYVLADLGGKSDTTKSYVCLSDGGHFDNMGIYELVRRKCRYIVLCDGEQDEEFSCEGLANAIRRCRIDFGVNIVMQGLEQITNRTDQRHSEKQYATGIIHYPDDPKNPGRLIYIKSSITGKEPADVREYAQKNEAFPHQSTGDQFFDEAQFESYRQLGLHIAEELFMPQKNPVQLTAHVQGQKRSTRLVK